MSDDNPSQLIIETAMAAYAVILQLSDENQRLRAFVQSVVDNGWLSKRSEGQPHELQMQARALLDSLDNPAAIE